MRRPCIWGILTGVCLWFPVKSLARRGSLKCWKSAFTSLAFALLLQGARAETRTLSAAWSFLLRYPCDSSPAVADDGTIYLGVWNGDFRAFRPDGTLKWTFHAGREVKSSPAIGPDGTVYFGSRDRKLYAVGSDGKKKWDFKTGAWVDSSPAIGADGTIYFGSWDKSFYALKPDGSKLWEFKTTGEIVSSPALGADSRIYFGSHDRNFYALTPSGQKAWAFATGGPILSSAAINSDGTIYFTSVDGFCYALNQDGSLKWRLKTGGITECSPVIGRDGMIYVGANSWLWAITPTGLKKWEQKCLLPIQASPLALADGSVCVVSPDGILINLKDPTQLNWTYNQNWYGTVSPVVGPGGTILTVGQIIGKGTFLDALPAEAALAHSPWPKFRANARNTGSIN